MPPTSLFRLGTLALAASLLILDVPALQAQGTGLVPSSDLVYLDIDRLSELGVLDSIIIGQRPYSRREIARIARVARGRLDGTRRPSHARYSDEVETLAQELLEHLDRFTTDPNDETFERATIAVIDGASLTVSSTDADRRRFPAIHTKPTEATIEPLAERRLGQPPARGHVAALELSHRIEPTGWLAFQARERVELRHPRDTTLSRTMGEVLLASVRARYRNVAMTVGRQQFTWSQSPGDGLFLASDAPALDQISLAGDRPFLLPGFLRIFGPTQVTLVVADLGPSVVRSHSRLVTYKGSVQPTSALELGGTFMNHFGGSGSPSAGFVDRAIDLMPFIDIFRKHNYFDSTKTINVESDKLLGVDGRLRLAGVLFTGELLIDDFDTRRLPKLLTGYGSQTFGIILPQLGSPALSAKLSVKHMGILTYSHGELLNGITARGRLLGEELGTDAKSYSAQLRWTPSAGVRFEVEGRSAIHSNATYESFYADPALTQYVVRKKSHTDDELRDIVLGSFILQDDDGFALTVRAGAERTRNANFQGGRRRDYVAQIALRLLH